MKGTVYLVGAGPGDPGLLTVKGQALLRKADVVVYDHLVSPRVLKECAPGAKICKPRASSSRAAHFCARHHKPSYRALDYDASRGRLREEMRRVAACLPLVPPADGSPGREG